MRDSRWRAAKLDGLSLTIGRDSGLTIPGRALVLLTIAINASGCSDSRKPSDYQAELENVAQCFHDAVTVLQAEPKTPDELAMFMKSAKAAVAVSSRDFVVARFNALRWNANGTLLVTESGSPIHCRRLDAGEDIYADGTVALIEYEFFVPGTDYLSQSTIELSMRK